MEDPVVSADGHTYERQAIVDWFKAKGNSASSPTTSLPLIDQSLRPNFSVRSQIADWVSKAPTPERSPAATPPLAPPAEVTTRLGELDNTLEEWLMSINPALKAYSDDLHQYGYENLDLLCMSDRHDFEEALLVLKVKKPHVKPLLKAFDKLVQSTSLVDLPGAVEFCPS
jgi:hypothetical protein